MAQKFDLRVAEDVFNPKLTLNSYYRSTRGSQDNARNASLAPSSSLLGEYGTRLSMAWTQQLNNANRAGRYRSDGLDLAIIQPLMRGAGWDATTAPLRLSRLAEQANRLNLKATVAQTISQIIATYRELLRAQEQLVIVQEALKRSTTLLEVNKALISAGRMAEFEIVQTEADIATQQLGVEEARNQLDTSRLALLRLLALDLSTPVRATEALEASPMEIDKRQAFNLAQNQQPEYLAALLGSQQADLNLVIAKDSGRWQVDLVAGANQIRAATDNDDGHNNKPHLGQLRRGASADPYWRYQHAPGRSACAGGMWRIRKSASPTLARNWSATSTMWCVTSAPAGANMKSPSAPWSCRGARSRSSGKNSVPDAPPTSRC